MPDSTQHDPCKETDQQTERETRGNTGLVSCNALYPNQEETKYLWLLMLPKEGYASNTSKE